MHLKKEKHKKKKKTLIRFFESSLGHFVYVLKHSSFIIYTGQLINNQRETI